MRRNADASNENHMQPREEVFRCQDSSCTIHAPFILMIDFAVL
ncbi:hypothetical protein SDC9_78116 [bioreactor metagenome]|uniref:Uncharacterized protein n=1 Tax=bioreactor metagenome TaxID=1076179 RepID=A0A644YSN4_9ZZZZ